MAPNESAHPRLPHIHLLCMEERFITAFEEARQRYKLPESVSVTIHDCALSQVPATVRFDTVVSPANSYGRLDGAFDDALSRVLAPRDDYHALTRAAQAELYRRYRGFAPPGSCTLVRVPDAFAGRNRNVWGVRRVALCPTMRQPANAVWDREVVYECVWSMLCAVDNHNQEASEARGGRPDDDDDTIRSVLMTPLATGVGRVSPERWAGQAVLALKHFVDASDNPDKWSKLEWAELGLYAVETETTWKLESRGDVRS